MINEIKKKYGIIFILSIIMVMLIFSNVYATSNIVNEINIQLTIPNAGTIVTIDDKDEIDLKHAQLPRPEIIVPVESNYKIAEYNYFGEISNAAFWYTDSEATELFSGEMFAGKTYYADLWFSGKEGYAISEDATVTINSGDLECIKTDFEAYDQSGDGVFRAIVPVTISGDEISFVPQNGIPLVIIRIDESEEAIQAANDEDVEHEYGTIKEMNESYHHTVRCVGTMEIVIPDGYESEYDISNNPIGEKKLSYVRGRGNSTWMLSNKKPYKIKYEKKQDVLGMGENKEWGLLANAYDPTLIHNDVVSWLGEQMEMNYTPKMIPVDVVMIGNKSGATFLGSYTLTELVDIGKNRVDIPELDDDDIDDITGGYLLSIYYSEQDFKEPENTVFETEYGKVKLINENPYFESGELTEAQEKQRAYIRDYVNQIDELIMNNDVITEEIHNQIADLLDLKSTADFYLMQEFLVNFDGFKTSSNYLYKTPDTEQKKGKLYFGPLWDFDLMFYMIDIKEPEQIKGFNRVMPFAWVDKLRNDDSFFVEILKEEWNTLNNEINNITKENGILDKYKETIRDSWITNYNQFKDENPFYGHETNIDNEIEELRTLFELRQKWFNDNIDDIGKVFFTVKFKVDDEVIKEEVVRGNTLMEAPEGIIPKKDGYLFKEWVRENDNTISISDQLIVSNVTFIPNYIKTDDIEGKVALYFPTYEVWIPLEDETYQLNGIACYPEEQYEGLSKSIVWKSSNEDVATIDYNGEVTLIKVGDTTITGTLFNGISKSYILHVCGENQEFVHNTTEVNFKKDEFTIEVGDTDQIIYHVLPEPVDSYIYADYELNNQGIIEFNSTTLSFIGLKEGKVTISLKVVNSDDDNYAEFEKDIIVNVKAKSSSKPKTGGRSSSKKETTKETIWSMVDDWALNEMEKAEKLVLIPEIFKGKDFTSQISRQDFTAIAVKLYESISDKKAILTDNNPFKDTKDEYVLKAYNLGITLGVSETEFGNSQITREQMATMIDRALKKAEINITLDLENVTKFADDNEMHDWGRPGVYAMVKEEIIKGVGDNKFNPLGEAKIEEAIAIALRCVEKYKR